MKKAAILVSAALICGTLVGYLCMRDNQPAAQTQTPQTDPVQYSATTRQPEEYQPSFTPVAVPEEMKQHYTVNPKVSQIVTGNSGTMLLIPDNAFTDKNGNAVSGKVKLELVEAVTREDLIAMNMGTMSDQGMLETGGSIYVGAKSESGEELVLAEGKIIEAEVPTFNKKPGMQIWEGKQNDDGTVMWTNPEPMKEVLTAVPVATLLDSTSAPVTNSPNAGVVDQLPQVGRRIFWYDWQSNLTIKAWGVKSRDSIYRWQGDTVFIPDYNQPADEVVIAAGRSGLDIVNFADKKFENTNIATAEFRSRLPYIKQACDARIGHCYADQPKRALWQSDAAAADSLEKMGCPLADVFRQFAKLKQGKIDPSDPNTTAAMDAARETAIKNYSKRVAESRAMYAPYKFGMKSLGWRNIDCMTGVTNPVGLAVNIGNKPSGQSLAVTLLIPGRGICLMGYPTQTGEYTFGGNAFPRGETGYILAKAGDGDNFSFALKQFLFGASEPVLAEMKNGTTDEMDIAMGNVPEERKAPELEIIDDWYTQSLKSGGCVCGAWTNNK